MAIRTEPDYIPGVCNINRKEIARRNDTAIFGVVFFMLYAMIIYYFSMEREWRLLIFIPAYIAAFSYLQARFQFCAVLGLKNQAKINDEITLHEEDAVKNRRRSIKIIIYAFIIASFATAIVYYFPV